MTLIIFWATDSRERKLWGRTSNYSIALEGIASFHYPKTITLLPVLIVHLTYSKSSIMLIELKRNSETYAIHTCFTLSNGMEAY